MLGTLARKILPVRAQQALKHWIRDSMPPSYGYQIIEGKVPAELSHGWKDAEVAKRQHGAFIPLLQAMQEGRPREDFVAVAAAVQGTGLKNPLIVEVGCGTGWNSEVLAYFLKSPVRYIGLDYSPAMAASGKRYYPDAQFVVADALALPFQTGACDILLSGTVIMHLLGYREAIGESRRITRQWCIFHTVPTVQKRPTTVLKKFAYGSPVVEVVLNLEEFLKLIESNDLVLRRAFDSVPHDYLSSSLGEPVSVRTYLCEVRSIEDGK